MSDKPTAYWYRHEIENLTTDRDAAISESKSWHTEHDKVCELTTELRAQLATAQEHIKELETDNGILLAQNTALRERLQSGGQVGKMVDYLEPYEDVNEFNDDVDTEGWMCKQLFVMEAGNVYAWWQRPVTSVAGDVSEESETGK